VQELEKEVRRLVNENLKLKRHCKQVNFVFPSLILLLLISRFITLHFQSIFYVYICMCIESFDFTTGIL
jgi:hypothetical protein